LGGIKMKGLVIEEQSEEDRLKRENDVSINIVSENTLIPVEEWSKLQELNQSEIPSEGDIFIPAEEWSRLQDVNTVEKKISRENISYHFSKNFFMSGATLQCNVLLPVDTIIEIDIELNDLQQNITTIGKVKWNKVISENESYEAGVEFVDIPGDSILKLQEQRQKDDAMIAKKDNMKHCRYCSREIEADAEQCAFCGKKLDRRTNKRIFL
jgi:hypothetical protein